MYHIVSPNISLILHTYIVQHRMTPNQILYYILTRLCTIVIFIEQGEHSHDSGSVDVSPVGPHNLKSLMEELAGAGFFVSVYYAQEFKPFMYMYVYIYIYIPTICMMYDKQ